VIGKRLAHYELLERLGVGGMGEVYRARDTRLGREVALKILPPALAGDPDRRARFEREARAVAALRHPSIVTIHAVEEDQGVPFLAMELVEGRPLSQVIPSEGLSLGRFLDLALPLTDAVAAAHAKGITHRDLKPDNVMVEPDGRVKVLDFGLAKLLESASVDDATLAAAPEATQEGRILGTVAYMSPEQAEGKPVDARSDVFSLGIVLYQMITGERPFQGGTNISTLTAILRDTPPPVHQRKRTAPAQLDRIVQRCLEKAPEKRYPTAKELRDELERLRVEGDSPAGPRKSVWPWVAGLLLVLGLAGAWVLTRHRGAAEIAASAPAAVPAAAKLPMIVVFPFENMGSAADEYFASGVSDEITSRLSTLQGLGVLSRTSAVQYDRKGKTMQKIAADLGVDYVLDGTVRWARGSGGKSEVRITPQLTRAQEDRQIWSASYDRSMDEIFRIQSEIASEVVGKLGMALADRERAGLEAPPTTSLEAYQDFLRARELVGSITFSKDDFDRGVALLEDACAKDPSFLRAWAELARAHAAFRHFAWDTSEERLARAKQAMDRALALDAASPWTQLALGYYFYQGRKEYEPAYAAFSKAHDGLPSSSDAIEAMGLVRRRQGRFDDAVAGLEKAIALDPQNALLHFTLGETLTIVRRYDDARRSLERAAALAPDPSSAYAVEARLAVLAGDLAGARALLARSAQGGQGSSEVRGSRFWIALDCRDYPAAQAFSVDIPEVSNAQFGFECRAAARGWVRKLQGDESGARAELQKARTLLEGYVRAHPDEANVRGALARVLAGLGEGEAALQEARTALTLPPATTDAWLRQWRMFDLAVVETWAGRHDDAVQHLSELLGQPSDQVSVPLLRQSPLFDPLRKHPGFVKRVEESAQGR